MKKQTNFQTSKTLYAVDLTSLERTQCGNIQSTGEPLYRYEILSVWFKKRNGLYTANTGILWDISKDFYYMKEEVEATTFLEKTLVDGRYGGRCRSTWDGSRLWSDPSLDRFAQEKDLRFLSVMLASYPAIPVGYDGWWSFK